jgi:phosphate/sulfate permease
MAATRPFGIPAVISASIWGGIWGVSFAYAFFQRLRGAAYWIVSVLAGAVLLSLVAAIIVSPMKGQGMMWGMDYSRMYMALCVNGCWGLGCAWFYKMMNAR